MDKPATRAKKTAGMKRLLAAKGVMEGVTDAVSQLLAPMPLTEAHDLSQFNSRRADA